MSTRLEVTFPGNKRIDARIGDMVIHTDQSTESGGEGTAPEPLQLFLASIATCSAVYAMEFCRSRSLSTEGMSLAMDCRWNEEEKRYDTLDISLHLPEGFPEKYRKAVLRVMDMCMVKKHLLNPPDITITAVEGS